MKNLRYYNPLWYYLWCQGVNEHNDWKITHSQTIFLGFPHRLSISVCIFAPSVPFIAYEWHLTHLRQEKVLHPFGCPALGTAGKPVVDGRWRWRMDYSPPARWGSLDFSKLRCNSSFSFFSSSSSASLLSSSSLPSFGASKEGSHLQLQECK